MKLAIKLNKLARRLDNDDFVKRNLVAISAIGSGNDIKAGRQNIATLLKAVQNSDGIDHERKRRFFRRIGSWFKRKARRIAAAARRKARWLAARARRLAAAARAKARRLALLAKRKALAIARKIKAKALAVVNWVKNKLGGFSGVLKAFRKSSIIVSIHITVT